ncbi:hypothetical protein NL676_037641 [Syzygium grande]|nr:hypothetical protein NL676_037641 [Syzygium grande]
MERKRRKVNKVNLRPIHRLQKSKKKKKKKKRDRRRRRRRRQKRSSPRLPPPRFSLASPSSTGISYLHTGHVPWTPSHRSIQPPWNRCLRGISFAGSPAATLSRRAAHSPLAAFLNLHARHGLDRPPRRRRPPALGSPLGVRAGGPDEDQAPGEGVDEDEPVRPGPEPEPVWSGRGAGAEKPKKKGGGVREGGGDGAFFLATLLLWLVSILFEIAFNDRRELLSILAGCCLYQAANWVVRRRVSRDPLFVNTAASLLHSTVTSASVSLSPLFLASWVETGSAGASGKFRLQSPVPKFSWHALFANSRVTRLGRLQKFGNKAVGLAAECVLVNPSFLADTILLKRRP